MAEGRRDLLIAGGTVVTMDPGRRILDEGAVLIQDGRIAAVGRLSEVEPLAVDADRVDATGDLVLPGFVNTHNHLFQGLLKGLGDDRPLYRWLREMTAPAAVALTEEDCVAAAELGAVEAIRSGVTTIVDFMYPHPRPRLTDAIIAGLERSGVRAVVCRGFVTRGTELGIPAALIETVDVALADAARLMDAWSRLDSRITVGVAPCLIWMVGESDLRATREFADSRRMVVSYHLAETSFEVEYAARTFGMRETELLERVGFLGPDLLAAHCTKVDSGDIARLRDHDVRVSHNPVSNMYLASGIAPIVAMDRAGLTIGLATDGPASNNNQNMVHVLKYAALLQKVAHEDPIAMTASQVLEMATLGGARSIGLEGEIGSIEVGKRADISVFSLRNAFVAPVHDPISSLVYASLGNEARTVVVDGRVVMRDGTITTLREEAVVERATVAAHALVRRAGISVGSPWRSSLAAHLVAADDPTPRWLPGSGH